MSSTISDMKTATSVIAALRRGGWVGGLTVFLALAASLSTAATALAFAYGMHLAGMRIDAGSQVMVAMIVLLSIGRTLYLGDLRFVRAPAARVRNPKVCAVTVSGAERSPWFVILALNLDVIALMSLIVSTAMSVLAPHTVIAGIGTTANEIIVFVAGLALSVTAQVSAALLLARVWAAMRTLPAVV